MVFRRILFSLLLAAIVPFARGDETAEDDEPLESSLVEKAGVRLVQLDVSVTGPRKTVADLRPEDFRLKVNRRKVSRFTVDRFCPAAEPRARPGRPAAPPDSPEDVRLGPTTFVFYFDQPHLTMTGRRQALDTARELVLLLIDSGNRAMIVSNTRELETVAELTDDPETLLDAIDRVEKDVGQWDTFAHDEERRVAEVVEAIELGGLRYAMSVARMYHAEELWRAEKDFRRFSMVLGRLARIDPPKVVVYLADNMRSNAGDHFLKIFEDVAKRELAADPQASGDLVGAGGQAFGAMPAFDEVANEASAHGVRLYTVQAEGLVAPSPTLPSRDRIRDAQDTLASLALETGGRYFLNGVEASRIARAIREDLSCVYLLSFSPLGFPEDRPLPVGVEVLRRKVKAQVRGRVVIQSESSRLTSRLLAAYASPEAGRSDIPLRSSLIPTGYGNGTFSALVQVAVVSSDYPSSTWELGASATSRGEVRTTSGRIAVRRPETPVVLQGRMTFTPGPYELVTVARDVSADEIASRREEGSWPNPDGDEPAFGPIAVLQPTVAAILKDGEPATSGPVAYDEDQPVRIDRPTALVTMVCRSRGQSPRLQVERRLVGKRSLDFPPLEVDLGAEHCALVQDVIPSETMEAGSFRYEIRALRGERELARAERRFSAAAPRS